MRLNALAVVALLLAGLAVPTAAAVAVDDPETDDVGAISLAPHDGPNGAYATVEDGELAVELDDLNAEAVTTADRVFTVTADEEPLRVAVVHDSAAVTVYRGGNPADAIDSREDAVLLQPGESLAVGVEVDTRGRDDVSLSSVTVLALSPDGEAVDETEVDMGDLAGSGADESDFDGVDLADDALVFVDGRVDDRELTAGEAVTATTTVTNRKNRSVTVTVPFRVDGVTVDERQVRVGADASTTVTFERRFERAGEYALAVGDSDLGTVEVLERDGPSPAFAVSNASVGSDAAAVGESVTVTATVANDGAADGTFTAELVVDGVVVDSQRVTVPAGERRSVTFERAFRSEGRVDVDVSGTDAGTVAVGTDSADLIDPSTLQTSASGLAIGVPLLLGAAIVRRRRRKGL
ncbi:CARDB domain-containing protein [Halostella litorea]|uniref:CARDB domain-containing protein n=1 Tax=Halostella litorea TaxID=2528831 RepID=UPI0010922814|nr:CARDB domain-containing protein [Halostella litorea]